MVDGAPTIVTFHIYYHHDVFLSPDPGTTHTTTLICKFALFSITTVRIVQ